ncbi:hypothetical protein Sden_3469 [Shewanella denitrificans OS217]|jgi:biotin carboxylase|uniref:ATP-grasp domain-containing protein n=1 Tax=Shewanella denitrificans (strain OS217 / ATCC BAA-1090 / DSM 15013) TaxID=318161 RepID=Q12II2_SHEDO|nr:ATP-grasp domain-containing protein [Shewanella denitrificans]ABE56744.1 hypothetical protein Sden_3469 [Shewanella denitrificans OS217]
MKGIISLIHGGKTFVDQIHSACQDAGIELYVISSNTVDADLLQNMSDKATVLEVIEGTDLNFESVLSFVEKLQQSNKQALACISVWENYRPLMARLNQALGAQDMCPEQVNLLRDKHLLRKVLYDAGLSQVNSRILTQEVFIQIQKNRELAFVKPRQGIASYGAFKLRPSTQWQQITEIAEQIQSDAVFSSSFADEVEFVAEDYISGVEFCFEIIHHDGQCNLIAIHEKLEVGEQNLTTLENVSASPPISLNRKQIEQANLWVSSIFERLELGSGCYHLEAKFDNNQWEVIEINPRIGGSYINESVAHVAGYSLLELWIRSLLRAGCSEYQAFLKVLSPHSEQFFERQQGSYFRVFFAEPNRTISRLNFKLGTPPIHKKLLMKEGQTTPNASRELFMAQALWSWSVSQDSVQTRAQISESLTALEVEYE